MSDLSSLFSPAGSFLSSAASVLESLEFEYKEIEDILEEIQSFAALEGFDPPVVEYVRELRCREIPGGFRLPVEGSAAGRVFRELSGRREYEIRELEAIALRDPVLSGSLVGVANSAPVSSTRTTDRPSALNPTSLCLRMLSRSLPGTLAKVCRVAVADPNQRAAGSPIQHRL